MKDFFKNDLYLNFINSKDEKHIKSIKIRMDELRFKRIFKLFL